MKFLRILAFVVLSIPIYSYAGYVVTGPVTAEDCYDFGISVCSTKTVTEVRKDGQRFQLPTYFEKVTEYNSSRGVCMIKTKSKDLGALSWALNAYSQPDFWGYDKKGNFGKIDADYIRFKCVER